MHSSDVIINSIFKDIAFTKPEVSFMENTFERVILTKGEIVLKAGERVTDQYYVYDGCLRTFFIDKAGKEHTIQFAIQDWWISDYIAFFTGEKAVLNIECIQNAILYKISKKNIEKTYDRIPKVERFFRKKMEKSFASFQKRILANLAQSAKERYVNFISTYPNIEQHIKNYHIASYLGITTESLSRIRKELTTS
ncbi:Crp/Fnr family transcriptional regulator [Aquimarina algiphila]|uniref:Crp/Fnr family transcriptional regulator n=2 Tax=Flavobacteriaceae TaxID=49546 RepID=A0A554VGF0_9FLAO|nr:Crp/Fnr family transcriptional regulator [Aquimarina algiphila]